MAGMTGFLLLFFEKIFSAIQKEKSLKTWPRNWKLNLINSFNKE